MESWSSLIDSLLSFASYNESIFRLQTFREYWLHFGSSPGWSYFFLPSRGSCLLAWIQTRIWGNSGFGFPCAQACFLGWDFLTTNISPHWRLIIHPTFCPTYSYIWKSSYVFLFIGRVPIRTEGAISIELLTLNLAPGLYTSMELSLFWAIELTLDTS